VQDTPLPGSSYCVCNSDDDCDDGNGCTGQVCDPAGSSSPGGCVYTSLTGTACDDGNACSGPDQCMDGFCAGATLTCDDGNQCTGDECLQPDGCTHPPSPEGFN